MSEIKVLKKSKNLSQLEFELRTSWKPSYLFTTYNKPRGLEIPKIIIFDSSTDSDELLVYIKTSFSKDQKEYCSIAIRNNTFQYITNIGWIKKKKQKSL